LVERALPVNGCCECCGQPLPSDIDPVAAKADELLAACEVRDIVISFDGYISERAAAELLGKSNHTLRNRRYTDRPLPFRKLGHVAEYSLIDLARFIVSDAED
jgi:hypothetical protein